jgi:hypothetical protein
MSTRKLISRILYSPAPIPRNATLQTPCIARHDTERSELARDSKGPLGQWSQARLL